MNWINEADVARWNNKSFATWIDEEAVANFSRFTIPLIRRNYPQHIPSVDGFYQEYGLENEEEEVNWTKEGF